MNKAGSTTIQQTFRTYRDDTLEYPRLSGWTEAFPDNGNHSRHLQMRFGLDVPARFHSSPDPAERQAERAAISADFDRAIDAARGSVILSAERLSEWRKPNRIAPLVAYLKARFDRINGLVYVRDPVSYMRSLLQQRIRVDALDPDMGLGGFYPGYRRRLAPWEDALGPDGLTFVPFDPAVFPEGDLLLDFAARTGVPTDWTRTRTEGRRTNVSLSAEALAVLVRYRKTYGDRPPHGAARTADTRMVSMLMGFGTRRFGLADSVVSPVLEANAADLDWITTRTGRSFGPCRPERADVTFARFADLMDYGAALGPALADWLARIKPPLPLPAGPPEAALLALRDALAQVRIEA
ncbi:MAG: hypothetical protein JJT81_11245 [Rubellimicrobium sp.]|nr:hypothetical protein [Rubellimicrobium sp.]